jgi:ankyrin repeat protein
MSSKSRGMPGVVVRVLGFMTILALAVTAYNRAMTRSRDENGRTGLMRAAAEGRCETVHYLLSIGARVRETDSRGRPVVAFAMDSHNLCCLTALLSAGANPNAIADPRTGQTLLHVLASDPSHVEILDALLSANADTNVFDRSGHTPLAIAIDSYNLRVVRRLLAKGANPNADLGETSVLGLACLRGRFEIVQALLTAGAKVTSSRQDVRQPLVYAARSPEVLSLLLAHGAKPNAKSKGGFSPLMSAANEGVPSCVSHLLRAGAMVNSKDRQGKTALMYAVSHRRGSSKEIVRQLLRVGAATELRDRNGHTALEYAITFNCFDGEEELRRNQALRMAEPKRRVLGD